MAPVPGASSDETGERHVPRPPRRATGPSPAAESSPTVAAGRHGRENSSPPPPTGGPPDPPAPSPAPDEPSAPRYRVLRPHAKGGLGTVYVAVDTEVGREVALKEIQDWAAADPGARARFLLEAEVTGNLEHPGVVPLYGVGTHPDGRPFYAMRFVRGDSLKEAIDRHHSPDGRLRPAAERRVAFRDLLRRFVDVCETVAYAHSRGVLHRDLKPGNVMLGTYGETLVVDWGLAKVVRGPRSLSGATPVGPSVPAGPAGTDGGAARTRADDLVGTPGYMSPEQADGRPDLGPASDVYSLGATLYQVLTGRPPVEGDDVSDVLRKVRGGAIERPRALDPSVPLALEAICLKAMAVRAADRYESPLALAADVERYLADEPVAALPDSAGQKAGRWMRRHTAAVRAAALALAVTAAAAAAAAAAVLEYAGREAAAARRARAAEQRVREERRDTERLAAAEAAARAAAERALLRSEWATYAGEVALADRAWREGDVLAALAHLRSCRRDFRDWEYDYLRRLMGGHRLVLRAHGSVRAAARADGEMVATAGHGDEVYVWDGGSGARLRRLTGHAGAVRDVRFVPGRRGRLATGGDDGTARLWDYETGREIGVVGRHEGGVTALAASDGGRLATAGRDRVVRVWDAEAPGVPSSQTPPLPADISALAFSPDGARLAAVGADGVARLVEVAGGAVAELPGNGDPVTAAAFHPGGGRVVTGHRGGAVRVRTADGAEAGRLDHPATPVLAVAYREDGGELATGGGDGVLRIWDPATGRPLRTLRGHAAAVVSLTYAGGGRRLVSGSEDGTAAIWNPRRDQGAARLPGHAAGVTAVSADRRGNRVATAGRDGAVRLWDAGREREVRTLSSGRPAVDAVALSPDGRRLAAGGGASLEVWDARTGRRLPTPPRATASGATAGAYTALAFSPGGDVLACGTSEGTIEFVRNDLTAVQAVRSAHRSGVSVLAFSPAGDALAAGGPDGRITLWDPRTGAPAGVLEGQAEPIVSLAFGPDGARLASGGGHPARPRSPGSLCVWDVPARARLYTALGHDGAVTGVAFSPSGRRVLTCSTDRTLRVWDAASGGEVFEIRNERPLTGLSVASRGNVVACAEAAGPDAAGPGTLRLFLADVAPVGRDGFPLRGHSAGVGGLSASPDGRRLTSGGVFGEVKVWEVETGLELSARKSGLSAVNRLESDAGGRRLVAAGPEGLRVWDGAGEEPGHPVPLAGGVTGLAVTPGGERAMVSTARGDLALYDLETGLPRWAAGPLDPPADCLRLDPRTGLAATGHADGTVRLWAADGREVGRTDPGAGPVADLAFAPDGGSLAAACAGPAGGDGRVRVFDVPSLELRRSIPGHVGAVRSVLYSPDGGTIASGGDDVVVRLWDARTGKPVGARHGANGVVRRLAGDPRGRWFYGATDGGPEAGAAPGDVWCWSWRGGDM